ncbi:uncharacterized protein LOC144768563 [Lissotriton helveticus]
MTASQKIEHRARMRAVKLQIEREEVALAQARLALAREQKLCGLDATSGSNIPREKDRSYDNRNPTKIVAPYKEGDDIHKWMTALERACMVQQVPQDQWAAILWYSFSEKGRDRHLTVRPEDAKHYSVLKSALIEGFGLTTEQYRLLFRDTQKAQTQNWTDFVDCATKALEGWLQGSKVSDYTGLYNLIMREQILNNCTNQLLHQYLIDSDLPSPQELGKKADKWVRTRIKQKPQNQGGDQKKTDQKGGNQKDKEKDQKSSGPQSSNKEGGSQNGNKKKKNNDPKKPWCNTCKSVSHWGSECTKTNPVPTTAAPKAPAPPSSVSSGGTQPKGVVGLTLGTEVGSGLVRIRTQAVLLYDVDLALSTTVSPSNLGKYRQTPLINEKLAQAYRDTCASVTMVTPDFVDPGQIVLGESYLVTNASNSTTSHSVAVVNFSWGGVNGLKKVVVSADLPVDCLLGNDLESSVWSEVEYRTHAEMLRISAHVLAVTRTQAKKCLPEPVVDLGTIDQPQPKRRSKRGKAEPSTLPQVEDQVSQETDSAVQEETVSEELEPDQVEFLGTGGPSRADLRQAQLDCPSLEPLRQQAAAEAAGDAQGTILCIRMMDSFIQRLETPSLVQPGGWSYL